MTVNTAVVDPRLMTRVGAPFFPIVGTIEEATPTQSDSGEESLSWAPVSGLEAVRLAFSPTVPNTEIRTDSLTRVVDTELALLQGCYPQITPAMRIVIDSEPWNILMVDVDSQHVLTVLRVERVFS